MPSSTRDLDAVRQLVERSRAAQGLPPTIEDQTTLDRVAALFQASPGGRRGR